jgi:ABC-type uncharacterized transport system permease subunit
MMFPMQNGLRQRNPVSAWFLTVLHNMLLGTSNKIVHIGLEFYTSASGQSC